MEILRAKTLDLRQTVPLSPLRAENSRLNQAEALAGAEELLSRPRRLVLELTSACNLRCAICGRGAREFRPTWFQVDWLKIFEDEVDHLEEVTLMGWGEPTIHPDFPRFLAWAHQRGLRKYFCTNGMRLKELEDDIFGTETDIIAVSLDGASRQSCEQIRRGADFPRIVRSLGKIADRRARHNSQWPYLNFVFTAMAGNFHELPELVRLAAELGLDEVKVVYFTAFDLALVSETLKGRQTELAEVFHLAEIMAGQLGLALKLPYLEGQDPAGQDPHKTCYTVWRDLFLGSDGRFRPCMSTARQFMAVTPESRLSQIWNTPDYQRHRRTVNTGDMDEYCRHCYQASCANWNQTHAFIQADLNFAPEW